jgi:hypothetical protein
LERNGKTMSPGKIMQGYETYMSGGEEWCISHTTPEIQEIYCRWCKAQAMDHIRSLRDMVSSFEYREMLLVFSESGSDYEWGAPTDVAGRGAAITAQIQTHTGYLQLLKELLRPHHGDVPIARVKTMWEESYEEIGPLMSICMGWQTEETADPNRQAPKTEEIPVGASPT